MTSNIRTAAMCFASACLAGCATHSHPPAKATPAATAAGKTGIVPPHWTREPSPDDFVHTFPALATKSGIRKGTATITCHVTVRGVLQACAVASETPAGYGFGDAALKIAKRFKFQPPLKDGHPIEGTITVPLNWNVF